MIVAPVSDKASGARGAHEELAGPTAAGPVGQAERISSMDVLRGFALMGILLVDIASFGMPEWNIDFPLQTVRPVFDGPHWRLNTVLWFGMWMVAKGKMRALFSMLFGAGAILMTRRAEARGAGIHTADLWLRRNMWLLLLGVLHAHLVWSSDILYFYGLAGLLVLFPCRNLRVRTLLVAGVLVLTASDVRWFVGMHRLMVGHRTAATAARAIERSGGLLTPAQQGAIQASDRDEAMLRPGKGALQAEIADHGRGYWFRRRSDWRKTTGLETTWVLNGELDVVGMMLIGMGLFRVGFLSARLRTRVYALTAVAGYGVAWPLIALGAWDARRHGFDLLRSTQDLYAGHDIDRLAGALANAAVVILVVKAGWMRWLVSRVAAVGQMALSNYLLMSVSMQVLFSLRALRWYGQMEYFQYYLVVLAMWVVDLLWSPLWLRRFRFGPVEWLWRSLTYWRRQPMRVESTARARERILTA